ncbi:pentatricopeptide repeat-containing protein At2g35030, mitochondrial-like [Phragmites australis]|uniref:pentatricopeptide repeat-containing protein At2g35030, mitochondrial-like n=1 Tax=Phragmites australis TaxID=29695 RepID=UPI002D7698F1|nr:pentatricopeptide repeat-containing protein At2g35030, mitochondrial-like [Phragmites australis]
MLRRRQRLLPLLLQCSRHRLHSTTAEPRPPPRRTGHAEIRSGNDNLAALKQQRGAAGARVVFDETPRRDAVHYAAMVGRHLKARDLPRAEALFRAAPAAARGLHLDTVMLNGYVKAGRVDRARELFDGMPMKSMVTWTCMISGYCRAGRVDEARQLFDVMPARNVVSWTAMVQGCASNGMLREAREMFDRMPERNVVAWTVMVKAYVDSDQIQEAWELFNRMPERNSYSWNAMISGFLSAGKVDEAVQLLERMPHRNVVSWTIMVTGLAKNGFACRAREFFDRMPEKDTAAWNAMITAYADNGQLNEAQRLFDSMVSKDLVSWNTVIEAYAKKEHKDEALRIFLLMRRSAVSPNSSTLTSILVISESTMEVKQIHGLVITLGLLSETSLGNALLTMYSRSGDLLSAWLAFKRMEEKDAITWTSIMQAFANHGCGYHALQCFAQMLRHGYKPSSTTFTAVLSACSHVGLVEKGQKMFKSIHHVYGVEPTIEHYSCLVDLLGRAGHVKEAKELVDAMQKGMLDEAILGTLLGACMMHNEVEVAREVGEDLVRFGPSGSGGYTLLANVFASHGMWDETASVWKIMRGSRVKKTSGFSQIEVNTTNHVFYSRDQEHPRCAEVYEMLNDTLIPQMKGSSCLRFLEPIL